MFDIYYINWCLILSSILQIYEWIPFSNPPEDDQELRQLLKDEQLGTPEVMPELGTWISRIFWKPSVFV